VSIVLLLQTRGRLTADELARTLEVSVRTIYRDMTALGEAGVPVYGDAGPDGGYQLVDGYRTRLTGLTADEAESLPLAAAPAAAADLGFDAVASAQLKLLAALPAELRARADRTAERFHLDAPTWYADAERPECLPALAEAVWRQRRVAFDYLRWTPPHEVARTAAPYGIVLKGGRWYVVAGDGDHIRTYRVSRIRSLRVLDDGFERPANFDLPGYWRRYLADFDARRWCGTATLVLSDTLFRLLPFFAEPAVAEAARATATPAGTGRVRVVIPIESVEQATPEILRFGADAEVLAPPELRARLTETLRRMAVVYQP
jgi:predicted DNA-binding transcriptional regulator YafY